MANSKDISTIVSLIEIILKYGPNAALKLFKLLNDDEEITSDKIRALKVADPSSYFKE